MKKDWHARKIEEILQHFYTSEQGLSEKEVKERIKKFGYNEIEERKRITPLIIFLRQFKSFLVLILLVAILISFAIGREGDAILISAIVLLNAFLGFAQEYRAEKAMYALKKLVVPKARVIREGKQKIVSSRELVPGDIILLSEGERVPADARLIEAVNLKVDESTLTGESTPVTKVVSTLEDVPLPERKNMVFLGTMIACGRAKAVVVDTGMHTEMGKIVGMLETGERETPLQIKLTAFGKWLGVIALIVCAVAFFLGIGRVEIPLMFLTAVTLAVSAVPEGLPAIVTITLALGMNRMAKQNAIIRKLSAVETLGSTTVIAADKTGTMTTNQMTVRKIYVNKKIIDVSGIGFRPRGDFFLEGRRIDLKKEKELRLLLKIGCLCNDATLIKDKEWCGIGDPTEVALIVAAAKAGFWQEKLKKSYPRIAEFPFSSERKMMTTIHTYKNKTLAFVKGAPEKVIELCSLDQKEKGALLEETKRMASEGLRVIALAFKELKDQNFSPKSVERDLNFVGLAGMIDPPREEVKRAIEVCKQAGIRVVMLTGDHKDTAIAIAKEIGLLKEGGMILTGFELDRMSEEEIEKVVNKVSVYARVSPEHKLKIVRALRKRGHVVTVTGDGVNDAPALKDADIGVAMGIKGTDVAKEASDMILADDNFASIVKAVEEGRVIYDNIRKFIRYILAVNFKEIFIITLAILVGLPFLPLTPIQILWINLLTDGLPALALSVDPKDPEIMKHRPRSPKEGILHGMVPFILAAGSVACLAGTAILAWELISGSSPEKARTMVFTTAILFEMFFVFNCRSERYSAFSKFSLSNKYLIAAVLVTIFLQVLVIYLPFFQSLLGTVPLNAFDWLKVILFASLGLLILPRVFLA